MKTWMLMAAVGFAITAGTSAQAATLFSNGPDLSNGQTGDCVYNTTCGPQFTGDTYAAQLFTLGSASTVSGFGFNAILLADAYGTAANYRVYSATADNAPGALIASGTAALSHVAGPSGPSFQTTDYSFGVSPLDLAAGNYVFAVQNVTTNFNDYLSKGAGSSGAFTSADGGLTFSPGYRGFDSAAVSVFGNAAAGVPEPATWALMILGFGAVGGSMRYRRNSTAASFA